MLTACSSFFGERRAAYRKPGSTGLSRLPPVARSQIPGRAARVAAAPVGFFTIELFVLLRLGIRFKKADGHLRHILQLPHQEILAPGRFSLS